MFLHIVAIAGALKRACKKMVHAKAFSNCRHNLIEFHECQLFKRSKKFLHFEFTFEFYELFKLLTVIESTKAHDEIIHEYNIFVKD